MPESGLFGKGSVADGYREHLEPVIFAPWAARLLELVQIGRGEAVLDVASGTGVVARAAAARVGPGGRVIATDLSVEMLAHVARGSDEDAAAIETRECSATSLAAADESVDVVLCQQGLPFIPDRIAAAREMRRVLRVGGRAGVAVWLSASRVEPFSIYGEALQAAGIGEPFPNAYDMSAMTMSTAEVEQAFAAAGFDDVTVAVEELEVVWPSEGAASQGVIGTPYGPVIAGLDRDLRDRVMTEIHERMKPTDGDAPRHRMAAVLGRGSAG